ncbi:ATP-binding protein [Paenibacillus lycopersici]|uniref:ATP-binding protein n=1 Tax=Paenibacillus lycopersici TaxID=2704462 RepID=A0A6C0FQE7_9BACL|nr:ATP-binding protein [Paenibacillus lycopersici]QHT59366.1 ATP-binding protein [Paenibacillus lycopersici]
MGTLGEALSVERARLFVGRDAELGLMHEWLTLKDPPTEIYFLSGMGGIGKSALMLQFLNMAQQEKVRSIWLDGRVCTDTPGGFLESLHAFLIHHPLVQASPNESISAIMAEMTRQKMLLCIDNYEYMHPIEGWFREVFLPELSANGLLVVLASRQDLSFNWMKDMAWQNRIRHIRLEPLARREAERYFTLRGLRQGSVVERLLGDSQGLPLAMALFVERLNFPIRDSAAPALPVSMRVSAEMLREVATSELKEALELLCILPHADSKWLGRLLEAPLTVVELERLTQFSFIRPTAGGLALHDVARSFLIEDFLQREPERYQIRRRSMMEGLAKELKQAAGQEQKRIASVMLSACRDLFLLDSVSIFAANVDFLQMQPYRGSDLPHLHRIIAEDIAHSISAELDHALLDALAEQFPESVRVFRSAEGIPLSFTAGILLCKETILFLERFLPGVLDDVFPQEIKHLRQLPLEQSDTYYQLLTGVSTRASDHSFHELVGTIVSDMIIHCTAALRFVIVTAYEQTNELLRNLGFRSRPLSSRTEEQPLFDALVHERDLRGSDVGDLLLGLIANPIDGGKADPSIALTEKEILTALTLSGHPAALEQTVLARKLSCGGLDLQQKLQRILSAHPPYPFTERDQAIVKVLAEAPPLTAEIAAEQLHVSRATYYRSRREAIQKLREFLAGVVL